MTDRDGPGPVRFPRHRPIYVTRREPDSTDEEATVATRAENWWRASATEWLKAAGIVVGGLAVAVLIVNLIIFVMGLL